MSRTRAFIAGGVGTIALFAAGTLPAFASNSGDTVTTFDLEAGTIDISASATASLPAGDSGQASVSGQLGQVTVTDGRGGTVSWTASAKSTVFTTTNGVATTNSTSVSYNSGTVNKTGDVTAAGTGPQTLSAIAGTAVVNGNAVVGNNTASWEPTLTVNLPSNSLAGEYEGTVTTSVA
jgi:hypothetical protein